VQSEAGALTVIAPSGSVSVTTPSALATVQFAGTGTEKRPAGS
jgi:hypothetical protein